MRRRNDNAVGEARGASAIVGEDGVGDDWGGGIFLASGQHDIDSVRGQDLKRTLNRGLRQGVGVDAEEQWSVDCVDLAVEADCLGYREDVPLIESFLERGAAVSRCAEDDTLRGNIRIGPLLVIGGDQLLYVDEVAWQRRLTCPGIDLHGTTHF